MNYGLLVSFMLLYAGHSLIYESSIPNAPAVILINPAPLESISHLLARKNRFFAFIFSPDDYFNKSVPTSFSVSSENGPNLPDWLDLEQSPNGFQAFVYGTPVKDNITYVLSVVAKNKLTYEIVRKKIRINVRPDSRISTTTQVAELWIQNVDLWQLVLDAHLMSELRLATARSFNKGRGVRPFFMRMEPGGADPSQDGGDSQGVILYVGTQRPEGFPTGVVFLSKGILRHPVECKRNDIVPLDVPFRPKFKIDWCKFRLSNLTRPGDVVDPSKSLDNAKRTFDQQLDERTPKKIFVSPKLWRIYTANDAHLATSDVKPFISVSGSESGMVKSRKRDYFWDWVMVAAVPLAVLIILLLLLSAIFFGCREGQHWRDYKTPQKQLSEYINLRRTQFNLRALTFRRQSMDSRRDVDSGVASPLTPFGKQTVGDMAHRRNLAAASSISPTSRFCDVDDFDDFVVDDRRSRQP